MLSPFHPQTRDAILCAAIGAPDNDLRQISGLGAGISSLSKIAIVGPPDASLAQKLRQMGPEWAWAGVSWADDVERAQDSQNGWDVVYRFGQVPVNGPRVVDWSSTCGNLVGGVAHYAIDSGAISQERLRAYFQSSNEAITSKHHAFTFPLRILAADSGKRILARVPVAVSNLGSAVTGTPDGLFFHPARSGDASIAGVPGTAAEILIESPLESGVLPSGNPRDIVKLADGEEVEVTLISTGLPTIFVSPQTVSPNLDPSILTSHPSKLDSHPDLHPRLESIRQAVGRQLLGGAISPSAPKICIVAPKAGLSYATTGGERVEEGDMDILVRPVSVGNFHRTVPATTLSALAAGSVYPTSTIAQAMRSSEAASSSQESVRTLTVGHCAGTASASVRIASTPAGPVPEAIVYVRTARRIMHGWVDLPALEEPLDPAASGSVAAGSRTPSWAPDPRWDAVEEEGEQTQLSPADAADALGRIGLAGTGPWSARRGAGWNGV